MHTRFRRRFFLALGCLAVAAGGVLAKELNSEDKTGRELYISFQCWQCHGYEGQGGAAARIATRSYPFEAFARFLRRPDLMPAYPPNLLDDEELRLIYEYLRSIPAPPPLEDVPELRND
ncbi:MAG: c-type cytochrome [Woeseiaceae bacterium]